MRLAIEHHTLSAPRARVVVVHGYAEHRGRYAELVARLEERGLECHLFDLRGHGQSEGSRAHVQRFRDYVDDLHRVAGEVPRDLPLFLLGHSLGGLISLAYVLAHPETFAAMAVSSPYLGPAFPVPKVQAALASVATFVAPAMKFDSPLESRWVSRDPEVVARYDTDPNVLHVTTPRWYTEVTRAQADVLAHAHEIHTPALIIAGGSDAIADHRLAITLFERLGTRDKQLRVHPALYHEVFNELADDRETVIRELVEDLVVERGVH
ncbi:MAG TPA: alpha/beta hydrolase, partial [Thermoanaerobaculia bacterium]|nr:alpha/beta hydrolase [Thermoanaerobaculia bacterium]